MKNEKLKEILEKHKKWLFEEKGGECANLRGADLRRADLEGADLEGADLEGANLRGAYLRCANLRCANLRGADLRRADLEGADLRRADLEGANLRGADLEGANLRGADLRGAYLEDADLKGAVLEGARLPHFLLTPEEGGFYAWKKTTRGIIKIYIPADAKRTNSLISRKCRASKVKVISGEGYGGMSPTKGNLIYNKGETVHADSFNDDIREECTNGIHFFMTKKEAEEW